MATKKASSGVPVRARKNRAGSTPTVTEQGTEVTPAASTFEDREAARLSSDDRRRTWYVLRCGERWVSEEASPGMNYVPWLLTGSISGAMRNWQLSITRDMCVRYSERYALLYEAPLVVEQVTVTVNGLMVGSGPIEEDDGDGWGQPAWLDGGLYNVALAEASAFEAEGHGEQIHILRNVLTHTQMWPLLRTRYDAELEAEKFEAGDWLYKDEALLNLAARLFYAGVVAGRREQGRKNVHGDLILDAPGMPYAEDN